MKYQKYIVCILIILNFCFCNQKDKNINQDIEIEDGIYSVKSITDNKDQIKNDNENYVTLSLIEKDSETKKEQTNFVTLDSKDFVPMIIEGKPNKKKDKRGLTLLTVKLQKEHVKALENFTEKYINSQIAIVLDKEIITIHKIRSVIRDGNFQITRCEDNACERIYSKLVK